MNPIPLSEAVSEIREELKRALDAADDRLRLEVNDIELELTLEISRKQGGGVKLSVLDILNLDGGADRNAVQHHRIKLSLSPKVVSGNGAKPRTLNLSAPEPIDERQ